MNICADTGFLIALYDPHDSDHDKADKLFSDYFDRPGNVLVLPWPVLYEGVSTKMTRRRAKIDGLERDLARLRARRQLELLDDGPFREQALQDCFAEARREPRHYRPPSLVDRVIRGLLSSADLKLDALITFNLGDFSDVCRQRRIILL